MKNFILMILLTLCLLGVGAQVKAADVLKKTTAEQIVKDTYLLVGYMGLKGEADYAVANNIIKAALFGAFDARARFDLEQETRQEEHKKPLPQTSPLFHVQNKAVRAQDVVFRDQQESFFKGLPEECNVFVSLEASELAALRFTGHKIANHASFKDKGELGLGDVRLAKNGYYFTVEGLGDLPMEPELRAIKPKENGYVLTGILNPTMDDGQKERTFTITITPGEVKGTWLRSFR